MTVVEENTINKDIKLCECGCKQEVKKRFLVGHHRRGTVPHNFKGGFISRYRYIHKPNYFSSMSRGYVREHVYIFQEFHKCCMLPWGDIHHINGIKSDNYNISNLQGMMKGKHTSLHRKMDFSNRLCLECNKKTLVNKNGHEYWYKYKDGYLCRKCHYKINKK